MTESAPQESRRLTVFLVDDRAAGSLEFAELSVCCLLLG